MSLFPSAVTLLGTMSDAQFMRLALRLARRGYGVTSPNPMVGAVLVKGGKIIGRGWHRRAGLPHAEIEALRDAQKHGHNPRSHGRNIGTKFLALEHSFHGRTMGSVATTHKEKYREPFAPVMPGVEFVRFNDVADLRAKFSKRQSAPSASKPSRARAASIRISQEFFAAARELCDSTGALLLADEIQSGMGRTGEWFAYQHYGILPDITTLAKPIANGLPMGAMLCTDEAALAITPGMHGTTFGGGPLACAVAIAVIDTMKQENLLAHIRDVGGYFQQQLSRLAARHDCIADVRGMGLMLGIELDSEDLAKRVAAADDGAPHHHQSHQRDRSALSSSLHSRAQARRYSHCGARRNLQSRDRHNGRRSAGRRAIPWVVKP